MTKLDFPDELFVQIVCLFLIWETIYYCQIKSFDKTTFIPLTLSLPGVEVRCIGHFKLLFSLLRLTGAEKLQKLALEVISTVTGNGKCVQSIADADVLAYLLLTLNTLPSCEFDFIFVSKIQCEPPLLRGVQLSTQALGERNQVCCSTGSTSENIGRSVGIIKIMFFKIQRRHSGKK